jgi:hypothetical protein
MSAFLSFFDAAIIGFLAQIIDGGLGMGLWSCFIKHAYILGHTSPACLRFFRHAACCSLILEQAQADIIEFGLNKISCIISKKCYNKIPQCSGAELPQAQKLCIFKRKERFVFSDNFDNKRKELSRIRVSAFLLHPDLSVKGAVDE